ncbi:OmpA family protein [Flavobacteriaceae bacterium R33]|uniref:OmpA family protein n=2 Tax=Poritiphilus flavus TaxID=2697053 RepID=A0A6L9E8G3_9FLAO|nr:OmpA family protein [Poritiphilus flavus]
MAASGYYIVAGVFGNPENAQKAVLKLSRQGLRPRIIRHRESNLNYVTLDFSRDWKEAISRCITNLEGKHKAAKWILQVAEEPSLVSANTPSEPTEVKSTKNATDFKSEAKRLKIANRSIAAIKGVNEGYYTIAGVFGAASNASRFAHGLKRKRFNSGTLFNPGGGMHYVYLNFHKDWREAIAQNTSKSKKSYKGKTWILKVGLPEREIAELISSMEKADSENAAEKDNRPVANQAEKKGRFNKRSSGKPLNDKLLEKADQYFAKMWYAEAAELYELFLSQNENEPHFEVIQKAGDSHYFNTNMERAYYWYDILYSRHKEEMSADNLFKYAHSLKGTGKYSRAKRLMRLYNRQMAKEEAAALNRYSRAKNEKVLDNILGTEENFSIKNIAVNSEYSDFAPMFYSENKVVFASAMDSSFFSTRRYKWNNQPYLDLYVAKINQESDEVRNAVKFSKKINTKYHEASVAFSPDNETMYFTRNNYGKKLKRDKNGINHLKIYMSTKRDGEWTEAREVSFNSDSYSTGHPALSPDGKQLYFVSDMPGSIGETDIFVVDILDDGQFSEPRNLGPEVNTERREMFPFISDRKLYFSSDGHVGIGGLDIYEATLDEENGFGGVRNIGKPVNSKVDDFSYIINEETQKGFFASNRRGGKGDDDIYSFKRLIPEEANKNAIAGVVTELVSGEVMPEALVMLLDENNRKLKEIVTGEDGSFVFEDLDSNTKYTLKTVKGDYFDNEQLITTRDNELVEAQVSMERLKELIAIEDGIKKLKTEMIYFDFDRHYIRSDASKELDKLVEVMNEYQDMVIRIESHTDSRGKRAYNKYLSDQRAKSTRDYLISKGIDPKRIESAIGYGEERLLNECDGSVRCSSAKHQMNRRSEFIIVSM